jgi:2'-5' RNA ligase
MINKKEKMARVFIALTPVKELNDKIVEIKKDLKVGLLKDHNISWQNNNSHHITLNFIGSMEPEQIDEMFVNLENIITSKSKIALEINSVSLFPNNKGQVLVANIKTTPQLNKIHTKIEQVINTIGFETHLKKYHPHITLGRFKEKERANIDIPELAEPVKSSVANIDVYESEFESGKTSYQLIKTFNY